MLRVKVCGITNLEDALLCARLGADALGFIFAESERRISPDQAKRIIEKLPPWIATVGVFANASPEEIAEIRRHSRFVWVQLHGSEPHDTACLFFPHVLKAIFDPGQADPDYPCSAFLLDRDKRRPLANPEFLKMAESLKPGKPLILAGGLNPDNLDPFLTLPVYGLDVARGVEAAPGKKDPEKVRQFIQKAKGWI